jgi:hypothetical protein
MRNFRLIRVRSSVTTNAFGVESALFRPRCLR